MDQEIKMESAAKLKEEIFIKIENGCEPELETNESAVLEDPLNVSSYAQGPFSYDIKSEIKTEISDVNEICSENVSRIESIFQIPVSTIQSPFEKELSSNNNAEDAGIPDYEKKRLENIAEKKAMFEEKLMNAKFAVRAKPFKCSKCLSEFMKKAQLKRHQCIKCDLCSKYFKTIQTVLFHDTMSQIYINHDKVEHDGQIAMKSKLKRPEREKKNLIRYEPGEFEEGKYVVEKLLDIKYPGEKSRRIPGQKSNTNTNKQFLVKWKGFGNEQNSWESKLRVPPKLIELFEEKQRIKSQSSDPQREVSASTEELEKEKIYIVEKLLDKRYLGAKRNRKQYLVKWKDYGNEHNSWESKACLPGNIVKTFEEGQWIKKQLLESEPRTNQNDLSNDGEQGDVKMMGPQNEVDLNITKSVQRF